MIWSVHQAGVDNHHLGIVNERTYLEALAAAESLYGGFIDEITNQRMTRTLVVEPGETQRERRRNRR